jgi:DNA-binding MarR family transcriptional regulator
MRADDPEDRRLVICKLSSEGQQLINRLWMGGRFQIENLLQGLTMEQLKKAAEVAGFILTSATAMNTNAQTPTSES